MYTHTSFGFCVTDHKQWFPEWAKKTHLNKCTCALFFFFKDSSTKSMPYCPSVQSNVTHKTRRNMAMISYSQCDIHIPQQPW